MESNRRNLSFTSDIIDEWVERTGKPRELLEEMFELHLEYVDKLKKETPDAINIRLPALGVLRLNYFMARAYTVNRNIAIIADVVRQKIKVLDKVREKRGYNVLNFRRPMFYLQYMSMTKKYLKYKFKKFYKIIKEVEDANYYDFYNKEQNKL